MVRAKIRAEVNKVIPITLRKAETVKTRRKKSRSRIKAVTLFAIIALNTVILLNGTLNRQKAQKRQ